jgi:hypothetical protein
MSWVGLSSGLVWFAFDDGKRNVCVRERELGRRGGM